MVAQQIWNGISNGMAYTMFALGLTLIFGIMGILQMSHGEFYMLGAMLAYVFNTVVGMNFFLAVSLAIACVVIVGFITNRLAVQPLIRASPLSVMLSTIAVSFIIMHGAAAIWGADPKPVPPFFSALLHVGPVSLSSDRIMLLVLGAMVIGALYLFLTKTKMGKVMIATTQNMLGARVVGIDIKAVFSFTFMLSTGIAALAGILLAPIWAAHPFMGQNILIRGFVIVIVAGMGSILGTVVIGLGVGIAEALIGHYISMLFKEALIYAAMVVVLLLKPEGLFPK